MKISPIIRLTSLIISFIILAACHPFVKYPSPPYTHPIALVGAGQGAAAGAVAAVATTSSVGVGAGIGAIIGGGIGTYINSEPRYLRELQKEGIQVVQIGDHVRIIIPSDKIFVLDTSTLLPQSYSRLLKVTYFIENYGTVPITVTGYGDDIGSPHRKRALTANQAKSVVAFFWSHGIPYSYLRAVGRGSKAPIAANYTSSGSYYNRRIEVTFPTRTN